MSYLDSLPQTPGLVSLVTEVKHGGTHPLTDGDVRRFFKKRKGQSVAPTVVQNPDVVIPYVRVAHALSAHPIMRAFYARYTPDYDMMTRPTLLPFTDFGFLAFFAGRKFMDVRVFERALRECLNEVQPVDHADPTGWVFGTMCRKMNIPLKSNDRTLRSHSSHSSTAS